jgi:hypothetical protein
MKTFTNRIALFAAGAVVLGTMAYGQNSVVKAEIPFAFEASGKTLKAGEYVLSPVQSRDGARIVVLRGVVSKQSVITIGTPVDPYATGSSAILFRCNADGCALAGMRSSEGTVTYGSAHKTPRAKEAAMIAVPLHVSNGD